MRHFEKTKKKESDESQLLCVCKSHFCTKLEKKQEVLVPEWDLFVKYCIIPSKHNVGILLFFLLTYFALLQVMAVDSFCQTSVG